MARWQTLVPGDPALTVAMTDAITSFLEWTLEKDLTPPQRQRLQKALVRYWKSPQERPGFQQILSAEIRRQRADPVDQEASREKLAPQVKANLQKLAKADADVAWLLSLPKATRKTPTAPAAPVERALAPGDPPLTTGLMDELTGFFQLVLKIPFTPTQKSELTRLTVAEWGQETTRQSVLELVQLWRQRDRIKPADMPETLRQYEARLAQALPEAARASRAAAWVLAAYDEAKKARPDAPGDAGDSRIVLVPPVAGGSRPPLTKGRVGYYARRFSYLFDTPLSASRRAELEQRLIAAWKKMPLYHDRLEGALEALQDVDTEIRDFSTAPGWGGGTYRMPESVRASGEKNAIESLRRRIADADARWVVAVYDEARRPLDGSMPEITMPLCRSISTALVFMINEIQGWRAAEWSESFEKVIQKKVLGEARKVTPAQRARLALFPRDWAQLEADWELLDVWGKEGLRVQWGEFLAPYIPELATMTRLRKKRHDAYRAAEKADWDRLTAAQAEARHAREMKALEAQARRDDQRFARQERMQLESHATMMNIISNLGPGNWRYEVRYR